MKAFQAYGKAGRAYGATPQEAGRAYFDAFPTSRKCDIVAGVRDGGFFTITYGRASAGEWPESYKDVTRKSVATLPGGTK